MLGLIVVSDVAGPGKGAQARTERRLEALSQERDDGDTDNRCRKVAPAPFHDQDDGVARPMASRDDRILH